MIEYATLNKRSKTSEKTIVAIDGEGVTINGDHFYTLLHASDGTFVEADNLSTVQCFEFLLQLKRYKDVPYLFAGFSINYDVNMWLKDLDAKRLAKLAEHESVWWNGYRITYKPSRMFSLRHRATKRSILIYDVFGFFQTSFVKALEDWGVGEPAQISRIAAMKDKRGTFDLTESASVRDYCAEECSLLVSLIRRLIESTRTAEIPCKQWYGAGALAAAMMEKFRVRDFIARPPKRFETAILSAYFGGRFEIRCSGEVGKVYGYDIKSAYPAVARSLPCLKHTTYAVVKKYDAKKLALWHVRWNTNSDLWTPFPWRNERRRILYPINGEGWYWSVEVAAAMRAFPNQIEVLDGITLTQTCNERPPFAFIDEVYAHRRRMEASGDFANKTLKLGLNSLYGKTAQSIGHKKKSPPFQSYMWAGMITAGCRAQILDAIAEDAESVISIATDGILSLRPIPTLKKGKSLGEWDASEWDSAFLIQPGIYRLANATTIIEHTRGFGKKETGWEDIIASFNRNPLGRHRYKATRFVGLRAAMAHADYTPYWRKWITSERDIKFYPESRFLLDLEHQEQPLLHIPPRLASIVPSTPYVPKMRWDDSWSDDKEALLDLEQP